MVQQTMDPDAFSNRPNPKKLFEINNLCHKESSFRLIFTYFMRLLMSFGRISILIIEQNYCMVCNVYRWSTLKTVSITAGDCLISPSPTRR